MSGENYVIYGLDHQARSLASLQADQEKPAFLVGSQSLRFMNQINLLEYDEDANQISRKIFSHSAGEIWHICCSPNDKNIFSTCYNSVSSDRKCQPGCSLWSLNDVVRKADGDNPELMELAKCDDLAQMGSAVGFYWQPVTNSTSALIAADNKVLITTIDGSSKHMKTLRQICAENRLTSKICSAKWNPHHNSNVIGVAVDSNVKGFDIRSKDDQAAFIIESCHPPIVRNLDFNPNRQYYIATCGDDCRIKFWDIRSCKSPLMTIEKHSHWVWSIKFNPVHDQLLLSCSSDARLILHSVTSVSSEAITNDENRSENGEDTDEAKVNDNVENNLGDGVIKTYEEHEDSVYCCEWSAADPWLFASLSYDGRIIVNKVLRNVKYKVLQL